MSEQICLNAKIDWQKLLPTLDIHLDRNALPATFQCPFCRRKRLTIYQDSINGGVWHHCSACRWCGDSLELAAKIWQMPLRETIERLVAVGQPLPDNAADQARLNTLNRRYYTRRTHFQELFQESRQYLASKPNSLRGLLDKFGLAFEQPGMVWRDRMGKYLGGLHQHKIIAHLQPYRTVRKESYSQSFIGSGNKYLRIFVGSNWQDVLVIPLHALPGLISGWLFVGRRGREEDFVFYPAYGYQSTSAQESGLAMYDTLLDPCVDTFGNTVFVFNDVMLALKMQSRHLRDSSLPMPIVGMFASSFLHLKNNQHKNIEPNRLWDSVPQREYVFWSQKPSAKLYNAAARANGRVCIAQYADHATWRSPKRLLSHIKQHAKPWIGSLEMTLRELSDVERDIFLEELNLPGHAKTEFLYSCTEGTKEMLAASEGSTVVPKKAMIGTNFVTETPNGWFVERTGALVSDAILRLERVIYQEENDAVWYQGYISYKGKQVPFMEAASAMEIRTMSWMKKKLIQENVGVMNFSPSWSSHAIQLAMHFGQPELVHTTGIFGWDPVKTAFVLPNMKIYLGGRVEEEAIPQITELAPAKELLPPDMILPDLAQLTLDTDENAVFWATAACVFANVLAPALNLPASGIGLYGAGAAAVGRLTARSLGCPEYHLTLPQGGVDALDTFKKVATQHRWPTILRLGGDNRYKILSPWLNSIEDVNAILEVTQTTADALSVQTSWRFVQCSHELTSSNLSLENGALLASHWLVSICERGLTLKSNAEPLARRVLDDLAAWVSERHGDGEAVRRALRLLDEGGDTVTSKATRLVSLVYHFIESGKLTIKREGYGAPSMKRPNSLIHVEKGYAKQAVFIPRALFNNLLARNRVPVPDAIQLTDVLTKADCLLGLSHNEIPGWLIDADWWGQQLRLCRSTRQQRLKVVGE